MPLVATASKTVRTKNLIMAVACAVFTVWFAYDGWVRYPAMNDNLVKMMIAKAESPIPSGLSEQEAHYLDENWPKENGWNNASSDLREKVTSMVKAKNAADEWKSPTDIMVQKWIVFGLLAATIASTIWLFRCQRRRVIADEATLSPEPGIVIPWNNITKVDNLRWKKTGIVDIEYKDDAGNTKSAELDDYLLDNLIPILEQLAERADKAEFINPPEEKSTSAANR